MIKIASLLLLMVIFSGCIDELKPIPESKTTPEPTIIYAIVETPAPAPNITIYAIPEKRLSASKFNISITTVDYNGNTTLAVEYPVNITITVDCNEKLYYPQITELANITAYIFYFSCGPGSKEKMIIDGKESFFIVPEIGKSWTYQI